MPIAMKLDNNAKTPSFQDVSEMLSKMKTLLIDVLLEKSLPDASRIKLKDCISMVENFSNFLNNNFKKQEESSDNLLKPLHSGLSKSSEHLNIKANAMSKSRSTSDLANFDWYDNDEDGDVDLNNLKENYLQAVNEFNHKSEINGEVNTSEINNIKTEVNYDTNQSKAEVNASIGDVVNSNDEQNNTRADLNGTNTGKGGAKPEANDTKSEVSENKVDVVRREGNVPKPHRKRDSSTLFDISLDDLTEPDHSGFLVEKHSGKEWWCVLQDQHLCMFPSQNPQELAYDVLLVPCCEISLDDVYTESPVFRLTQVGSTPWVFSAGIERNLRAWIRALYRACGRDDADWSMRSSKKGRGRKCKSQKRNMKVFTSTIDESEEVEEQEEDVEETNKAMVEDKKPLENAITDNEPIGGEHGNRENGMKLLEEDDKDDVNAEGDKEVEDEKKEKTEDMKQEEEEGKDESEVDMGEQEVRKCLATNEGSKIEENLKECDTEVKQEGNKNKNFNEPKKEDELSLITNASEGTKDGKQKTDDENGSNTCPPKIAFDDDHSDYVIMSKDAGKNPEAQNPDCDNDAALRSIERKTTKKRIKMLRWLKKAIVDKGQDDTTVIGDIYRIKSVDNHVKLWCLLRDRQLYCYLNMTDTTPDCVIPLDNCSAVPTTVISGKKFAFDIEKEGVKLATFAARSAKERARWFEIVKSKRGMIPLAEIEDDSGDEAAGSGTSEDDDNDSHEYVQVGDLKAKIAFKPEGEYVLPMSEDGYKDAGYISVIALESEINLRKMTKKKKKYNPNITSKSGIEYLNEKDAPSTLVSTIKTDVSSACKNRLPPPLPKLPAILSRKVQAEAATDVPQIHLDCDAKTKRDNEPEKSIENDKDLNNNMDIESSEKENFSGEFAADEQLSVNERDILHCQLSASSWLSDSPPSQARFGLRQNCRKNLTGAWRPETSDKTQFLEVDLGDVMTVSAIAVKGRPDFNENGGEFVKSFTIHYSVDNETWTPYKSHGKLKIFQGISSANQDYKKYFKTKTAAQYFRIHPQTWHNHVALRVALYKEEDVKSKGMKKKGDKPKPMSPVTDLPVSPVSPNSGKKAQLKKEDISDPMYPSSDCLKTEVYHIGDIKSANIESSFDSSDSPASIESRIKLREKLLSKEKREQITKLEVLKKHVDQAKDRMIVTNTSGQLKREAIESEHDYLVANLELVKAKKRLIDIETEMRELRLFGEKYNAEQQEGQGMVKPTGTEKSVEVEICETQEKPTQVGRPTEIKRPKKPPIKRRPSKEVMMWNDDVSPVVDPKEFNSPGDPPPALKVLNNVKLFENLKKQ